MVQRFNQSFELELDMEVSVEKKRIVLARSERIVNVFWIVMASSNGGGAVGCSALHK